MAAGDAAGAFERLEAALDGGADPEQLMRGLVTQLRYALLLQQGAHAREEWALAPEELDRLHAQANQLPPSQVVRGLDLLADAQIRIRYGQADPRVQLELVAAKLGRPPLDPHVEALAARVEALERGDARERPADAGPVAKAAPAAQAREPVVADLAHVERLWPQVLAALEAEAPHLHGFLLDSRVLDVQDGRVTVGVAGSVGAQLLRQPDEGRRLQAALSALAGRPLEVRIAEVEAQPSEAAPQQADPSERELMERLRTEFNADVEEAPWPSA
jgi:DNA polymerase III gamma/tau subunit